MVDCVEGASVRLLQGGEVVAETTSDNYGDFKFDKLDENSGAYVVEIAEGRQEEDRGGEARRKHQSGRDTDLANRCPEASSNARPHGAEPRAARRLEPWQQVRTRGHRSRRLASLGLLSMRQSGGTMSQLSE